MEAAGGVKGVIAKAGSSRTRIAGCKGNVDDAENGDDVGAEGVDEGERKGLDKCLDAASRIIATNRLLRETLRLRGGVPADESRLTAAVVAELGRTVRDEASRIVAANVAARGVDADVEREMRERIAALEAELAAERRRSALRDAQNRRLVELLSTMERERKVLLEERRRALTSAQST